MRKWMRDRMKRRNKPGSAQGNQDPNQPAPLQPTFLDREESGEQRPSAAESQEPQQPQQPQQPQRPAERQRSRPKRQAAAETQPEPQYEAQPERDPHDAEGEEPSEGSEEAAGPGGARNRRGRGGRSRRRGRGGKGRRTPQQEAAAAQASAAPTLPIQPGQATGEASEVDGIVPAEPVPQEPTPVPVPSARKGKAPRGAVVLAIGLPGSGKSSWFRRHNIIPLSSDLVRGLLFDDPTEQRFQDLVFSTLRYMLRMRLVAGRPMNYIDATNLSPKERHSWIKMAKEYHFDAHAVFFDVPTEVCMERNRKRSRNVPDDVMLRMAQKLRPPKFEEGFAKVTIVRLKKAEKKEPSEHEPLAEPEE